MGRKPVTVMDGPMEGQVFDLDLAVGEEVRLRLPDGRSAIHRAEADWEHGDSIGHHVLCLKFVAIAAQQ